MRKQVESFKENREEEAVIAQDCFQLKRQSGDLEKPSETLEELEMLLQSNKASQKELKEKRRRAKEAFEQE